MTEAQLREKIVAKAKSFLGYRESDGSYRQIIDLYNSHRPLARGYALQYDDDWCAGFVSAVSIACGMTQILPTEVGCGKMIARFRELDSWVERDSYVPKPGDVIFYDWTDSGYGDNQTEPDHVGLVTACDGKTITVIEGNLSDAVGYRTVAVDARYTRGFGTPRYGKLAEPVKPVQPEKPEQPKEVDEVRYRLMKEVRSETYRATLEKLVKKGLLKGRGGEGEELILDLSEDSVRLLVMLDRAGVFGA